MALIKCPECGKEISDKAASCPNCGCPISLAKPSTQVKIKIPRGENFTLLVSPTVTITSAVTTLWQGKPGQVAVFDITSPTDITINMGSWANPVNGRVEPGKKYSLMLDMGVHLFATHVLTEVDVIDSE